MANITTKSQRPTVPVVERTGISLAAFTATLERYERSVAASKQFNAAQVRS